MADPTHRSGVDDLPGGGRPRVAWLPLDDDGQPVDLLPLHRLLGWEDSGPDLEGLVEPADAARLAALLGPFPASGSGTVRARGPAGQPRHLHVMRQPNSSIAMAYDVTEWKQRAQRLADRTAWLQAVAEQGDEVVAVLRGTGAARHTWMLCGAVRRLLGHEPEELLLRARWDVVHPDDAPRITAALDALAPGDRHRLELRTRSPDGSWTRLQALLAEQTGVSPVDGVLVVLRPLTAVAAFDAQTGLPDRSLFLDRMRRVLRRGHEDGPSAAVLLLRLDRFDAVRDALGRRAGDELLEAIADRLQALVEEADSIARIGPADFAVLVEGITDIRRLTALCEVLRAAVHEPLEVGGQQVFTTASLGVATTAPELLRAEDLLEAADSALRRAADTPGGVAVYDAATQERLRARLELEAQLRFARQRGELALAYQPIVSLADGSLAGFEALLRWNRPGPAVGPSDFVPLAEESDAIHGIGRWVLDRACDHAAAWHRMGAEVYVSVNVSTKQLSDPGLVPAVASTLGRTRLPPRLLKLEITETALVERPEAARDVLDRIRQLGVRLVLDDFGTGFSSLSYLHRLPFDAIKIDRTFVTEITGGGTTPIVPVVVALGEATGMEVVAEGIETVAQLQHLQALGCGYGQGFLFDQPLDDEQALAASVATRTWPPEAR